MNRRSPIDSAVATTKGDDGTTGLLYGGATIAAAEAKVLGLQVVGDEAYPGTATDFTPQIVKLRDAKPDVVVLWGATTTPGLAIRAARTLGLNVPILGSSGILSRHPAHSLLWAA